MALLELTEEQEALRETFRRFVDREVVPRAEALDEAKAFPRELFGQLAAMGLFGLRYPEEVGGSGQDLFTFCLVIEEVARGSLSLAAAATMQSLMGTHFVHALGNRDLRERLLKPALRGEKIGTICITEPDAGSDLSAIATTAVRAEGGYRLRGRKMWVTSAPVADFFTVFARAGPEKKLTIFLVERTFPGCTVGRTIEKMGVWASPTAELVLEDCRVPETHRLGGEGEGEEALRRILAAIRIVTGALAVGVARAALESSLQYAAERVQFGRPILRFQAIQLKLAEMATRLEASRLLVAHAARLHDAGRSHHLEAAMAKLFATESAAWICDEACRIAASYGYAMEYPQQRYFRDVRFTLIGGGTSEILRLLIARQLSETTPRT